MGQTKRALEVAKSALEAQPTLSPQTLLAIARISRARHLGLEPGIADLLA
jgi:hypothetical protein